MICFNLKADEQDDKQYDATEAKILKHKTELNEFLIQTLEFSNDRHFFFFFFYIYSFKKQTCMCHDFVRLYDFRQDIFYFGF